MALRKLTQAEQIRQRERNDELMRLARSGEPGAADRCMALLEEEVAERRARVQRRETEEKLAAVAAQQRAKAQQQAVVQLSNGQVLNHDGNIRNMYLYRKSQVICDLTVLFCSRYVTDYHDRTKDQMIQAARSGKQNFIEGWEDGKSSTQMRLHLMSVGKGSLQELMEDYEDYLRQHSLPIWDKEHPRYASLVSYCLPRNDVDDYRKVWDKMNAEELANMALTLLHQIDRMADKFLRRLEADVIAGGSTQQVQAEINAALRCLRR